jgi:hypothetical protein
MTGKLAVCLTVLLAALAVAGCVERKMLIRSEPPAAPVWVDEEYAGVTPLDYPFAFYGGRRIRVGPIRDENQKVVYREMERVVEVEGPWYDDFPFDLFLEIYPHKLIREHPVPTFELARWDEGPQRPAAERLREVEEQAKEFRTKALGTIPEQAPPE